MASFQRINDSIIGVSAKLLHVRYDISDEEGERFRTRTYDSKQPQASDVRLGRYIRPLLQQTMHFTFDRYGKILNDQELGEPDAYKREEADQLFGISGSWTSGAMLSLKPHIGEVIGKIVLFMKASILSNEDSMTWRGTQNQPVKDTILDVMIPGLFRPKLESYDVSFSSHEVTTDSIFVRDRRGGKLNVEWKHVLSRQSTSRLMGELLDMTENAITSATAELNSSLLLLYFHGESQMEITAEKNNKSYKLSEARMAIQWNQ